MKTTNMGTIKILNPGLLSSIQDAGRYGYQQYGMPVAGAMDTDALQFANWCVGNSSNEACIESTIIGASLEFNCGTTIALCGAKVQAKINGEFAEMNRSLQVKTGDKLEMGNVQAGCRIYLAIAGGFNIPDLMASKSTYLRGKFGGFEGKALASGDEIEVNESGKQIKRRLPQALISDFSNNTSIRITAGAEVRRFTQEGIKSFLCSTYTVSAQSDRMGYRLSGAKIEHTDGADIISSGISTGAIQVPGHGAPIIMMADHQTVGGYTKIANVIAADLPLLGQMKPGDKITFKEVSLEKAQNILIEKHRIRQELLK
ncbi:biotin-dependent carboxyltransferase family protein [Ancylomarina sp. DW003]|nr:biotin-dependent carboxyltransferase family protein [Ancylomarina sp. DW003]MDE5422510.1 biotin-dependent carboxyltransferase family protein [Ancylomarina sp. DW003]